VHKIKAVQREDKQVNLAQG